MIKLIESDDSLPEIETSYRDNSGISWEQHVFQGRSITIAQTRIEDTANNIRLQLNSHRKNGEMRHTLSILN